LTDIKNRRNRRFRSQSGRRRLAGSGPGSRQARSGDGYDLGKAASETGSARSQQQRVKGAHIHDSWAATVAKQGMSTLLEGVEIGRKKTT
jgi:hypothetical protein